MAKRKRKQKFRVRYIVLGVLALLIVAVGTVTVTNWDNIQAGYEGLTTDPAEIQAKQQEKKSQLEQDLGVGDGFSEEEMSNAQEAIASILPDSLAEFVSGSNSADVKNGTGSSSGTSENGSSTVVGDNSGTEVTTDTGNGSAGNVSGTSEGGSSNGSSPTSTSNNSSSGSNSGSNVSSGSDTNSAEAITRKYTAQLYALEGTLQGKIDSLTSSAKAEYLALPESERTSSKKASIISSKIDEAGELESVTDAAVETILSNMKSELEAVGGDTSTVSQLRDYYESEKDSKKAAAVAAMRAG